MKFFITSGTRDFMKSLGKKYANENMIVMEGIGNSLLIHETTRDSVFQSPMKYEVIASAGSLQEEGYFALHHVPTTDEGRPIFEHWMSSRVDNVENEAGFLAHRLLRPASSNTYIFLTEWTDKTFFDLWKDSISYQKIIKDNKNGTGLERKPHIFSSAPYVTTYKAKQDDK